MVVAAMTNGFKLPAPAKLNLCLRIVGRQADGYHLLQTAFHLLTLADEIIFTPAASIQFESTMMLAEADNLVLRAARLLAEYTATTTGVSLKLIKHIPIGAGLGGGSSDAATTLVGLNYFWQLGLNTHTLMQLGQHLGADVPVFIMGHSAWGEGIGERLKPLVLPQKFYLLVQPNCQVSTAEIFNHPDLTQDTSAITISRFLAFGAKNDCEAVTRQVYPEVDRALSWLGQWGLAKMTGTGSCVFLGFDHAAAASALALKVPANWKSWVAVGVNQSPLVRGLAQLNKIE